MQPFGHNRHGPKIGGLPPFWEGGAGSQSNTTSLGSRPTSIPSGILIHRAIGHNRYGPKIGGCVPVGEGDLGPHLTQCGQGRGLPDDRFTNGRPKIHTNCETRSYKVIVLSYSLYFLCVCRFTYKLCKEFNFRDFLEWTDIEIRINLLVFISQIRGQIHDFLSWTC